MEGGNVATALHFFSHVAKPLGVYTLFCLLPVASLHMLQVTGKQVLPGVTVSMHLHKERKHFYVDLGAIS